MPQSVTALPAHSEPPSDAFLYPEASDPEHDDESHARFHAKSDFRARPDAVAPRVPVPAASTTAPCVPPRAPGATMHASKRSAADRAPRAHQTAAFASATPLLAAAAAADPLRGRSRARRPCPGAARTVPRAELVPRPGRDFYGIPNPAPGAPLRLSDLRERLIRQEETIIFALIERAQFRLNPLIYRAGAFDIPDFDGTFSQYVLYELEKVYAKVRRYTSPDEHPFAPAESLPAPLLPNLEFPGTLIENSINYNDKVEAMYLDTILPVVCEEGDDQNYGSSATCDVACLQALSKRIHYGKFIAESKYAEGPAEYGGLARKGDRDGIWDLLSNLKVEEVLLARVENKAKNYGSDISDAGARDVFKVEPAAIARIYRDFIIPLTKDVEVDYILERAKVESDVLA